MYKGFIYRNTIGTMRVVDEYINTFGVVNFDSSKYDADLKTENEIITEMLEYSNSIKGSKSETVFMGIAKAFSLHSTAQKAKVGCVIVDDNRGTIIGKGFNTVPFPHHDKQPEYMGVDSKCVNNEPRLLTASYLLHAELMAVLDIDEIVSGNRMSAYVTHYPCSHCQGVLLQKGINTIYIPKGTTGKSEDIKTAEQLKTIIKEI